MSLKVNKEGVEKHLEKEKALKLMQWLEVVDIVKDIDSQDVMDLDDTELSDNMWSEHMVPMFMDPFNYSNECTVEGWE